MYRVFYDRLVDDKDRAWLHRYVTCGFVLPCMSPVIVSDSCLFLFCSLLKTVTKEHLKDDFDSLFKRLSSDNKSVSTIEFFVYFVSIIILIYICYYHICRYSCLYKKVPSFQSLKIF